jgi:hypothetical protein
VLQQLQQLQLHGNGARHDSSTASSHSSITQQTHEVFKACFTYLHPVSVIRVMASSKALSALSMQQLRTGQARHAARQLLVTAVEGAAASHTNSCGLEETQQYNCSQYCQQQCAHAVTWLLKTAGPEVVATPADCNSNSSNNRNHTAGVSSRAAYQAEHGQSLCSQSDAASSWQVASRLVSIPEVPLAVTRQLAAAGLRVRYDQAVAAAGQGVPGVHTWLVAQLQQGVSLEAVGLPAYFRDAVVLQRRLEQQQAAAAKQVRGTQEAVCAGTRGGSVVG